MIDFGSVIAVFESLTVRSSSNLEWTAEDVPQRTRG
jgi:hypothetical protein